MRILKVFLGCCCVAFVAEAKTIVSGDVTALLGPGFFLDDAAVGGGDQTTGSINLIRSFDGLQVGSQGSDISISGIGWASSASGTTATEVMTSITYLGADGVAGGDDDVFIGSATNALIFSGAGEYVWEFDAPMIATIDGSNAWFLIHINTAGTGTIRFKKDSVSGDVKLSVAGSSVAEQVPNLALFRPIAGTSKQDFLPYVTDGVVGNDFNWIMDGSDSLPQTLDMAFPGPVEIGSYHLFVGKNNRNLARAWRLQYRLNGSAWADVPGSAVSSNTQSERNIIFSPIWVDELRLLITANAGDGRPRIREWAVFPPNNGNGYPLGTGVTINIAQDGWTVADSRVDGKFARLATDGYLGTAWESGATGPHSLEVLLRDEIEIGSAHLYSGDGAGSNVLSDFELEYSNDSGTTWLAVPGGTISGNTNADLVVNFSSAVAADMVRLVSTNAGSVVVRELAVYSDNANGGYSMGADVRRGSPPPQQFEDYSDSFYRIRSVKDQRVLSSGVPVEEHRLDKAQIYQVLLNGENGHYRLFNRETRHCLAVKDASLEAGAEIVEEEYSAFPSQQWRIVGAGLGQVYFENVFSGMRLASADDGTVQWPRTSDDAQRWSIDFVRLYPKKGGAGNADLADDMGASWWYGWTAKTHPDLNTNVVDFTPMQWGGGNLDPDNYQADKGQLPLTVRFPDWSSRGNPTVLLGFNEPDGEDQANLAVEKAISLWPQLMASRLPLASPAAVGWTRDWMGDWIAEADAHGYRYEYLAMHTYPGPDAANVSANVSAFSAAYDNRPVMLTEFGFVDWSGGTPWTENQLYNEMQELLWRLENNPDCKRYSLFGGKEKASAPVPVDPTGPVGKSDWQYEDGSFTALGEMYMGWDGDTTPNGDQPYILHHRSFSMRVANDGTSTVDAVNIRTSDASAQVIFETIGNGYYYIVSSLDGKRLRKASASSVTWAPANTTSTDAQWSWSLMEAGWHLVQNRAGGNLRYSDTGGVHMGTGDGNYYHWFMVSPMTPVDSVAPRAVTGLAASPSHKRVDLVWVDSLSEDAVSFIVKRSTVAGGPYDVVQTGVVADGFSDSGLVNGTTYYYVIETVDASGNVSATSEMAVTPVAPDPDTYANWVLAAFDGAPDGFDTSESGNEDGDAYSNLAEYFFLLNPLQADDAPVSIVATNAVLLQFMANRYASDVEWSIESVNSLTDPSGWSNCNFSIQQEEEVGDFVKFVVMPDHQEEDASFYRVRVEK